MLPSGVVVPEPSLGRVACCRQGWELPSCRQGWLVPPPVGVLRATRVAVPLGEVDQQQHYWTLPQQSCTNEG